MLSIPLLLAAGAFIAAMPLSWHHRDMPAAGYTVIHGIEGASWLLVAAAVVVVVAMRSVYRQPGFYSKWLLTITTFAVALGMYADYVNAQSAAARVFVDSYNGAGFYVGLAGGACVMVSAVIAWRLAAPL